MKARLVVGRERCLMKSVNSDHLVSFIPQSVFSRIYAMYACGLRCPVASGPQREYGKSDSSVYIKSRFRANNQRPHQTLMFP